MMIKSFPYPKILDTNGVSIRWTHNWMCLFYHQQQGMKNSNHQSLSHAERRSLILVCKRPNCKVSHHIVQRVPTICQLFFVSRHNVKKCFWFFPFYLFFVFSFAVPTFKTGPNPTFSPTKNVWKYKKKHNLLLPPQPLPVRSWFPGHVKNIHQKITTSQIYVCFDHKPL